MSYVEKLKAAYLALSQTKEVDEISEILNSITPTDSYEFGFVDSIRILSKNHQFIKLLNQVPQYSFMLLVTNGQNIIRHFKLKGINIQYNTKSFRFIVNGKPSHHDVYDNTLDSPCNKA